MMAGKQVPVTRGFRPISLSKSSRPWKLFGRECEGGRAFAKDVFFVRVFGVGVLAKFRVIGMNAGGGGSGSGLFREALTHLSTRLKQQNSVLNKRGDNVE